MGLWAYRFLLHLLPREFRKEFGEEMVRVAHEHWAEVRPRLGPWGRLRFWALEGAAVMKEARRMRFEGPRGHPRDRRDLMHGFTQDLRHSLRSFARTPGFTLVTVLTLGLGIGATTAIFSAVHAVLFRELPYGGAERIVTLFQTDVETRERGSGVSAANIRDLARTSGQLAHVAVAEPWSLDLQKEHRTETLRTWAVSEGFFEALGAGALHGRTFASEEYQEGHERVLVVGHRSWVGRFGADPGLVGSTIQLDGEAYMVVGVLPATFRFPDRAEAWIPRPARPWDASSRAADFMAGVARLAPGATLAQAQDEVDRLAASLADEYPDTNAGVGFHLLPLREHLFGDVRTALLVILGASAAVLLMACSNVAGLMLARGAHRQREYALRSALGASAGRLVRHVTVESLLLAGAGCALGLALTYAGVRGIQGLGADHLPRIEELRIDATVLVFALVMGGLSALLSGVAPSLRFSRPDLRDALGEGARGATPGRGRNALRRRLVVGEIALAVVLLIGAGLLVKSFALLTQRDLGFDHTRRLALQIFAYGYGSPENRLVFVDQVIREMEALPGVEGVALTSNLPGSNDASIASIDIEAPFFRVDQPSPAPGQEPTASVSIVLPGFFELMGIPLARGRAFLSSDDRQGARVVLVNEAMARRYYPGEDPVGKRVAVLFGQGSSSELSRDLGSDAGSEIVGVVRDVRPLGFESEPRPEIYLPLAQGGDWGSLTFLIRTVGDPAPMTTPVTEAIWRVNPGQSVWGVSTLEALLADTLRERRFNLLLLVGFGAVALILAAVGIYGLISFSVEQRVGEMGIRRALGGRSTDIVVMVLREGALLALGGIGLGIAAALLLTRFLQGMLFGVEPTDPLTFGGLAATVLVVSGIAAVLPALRATRVDPAVSLRAE